MTEKEIEELLETETRYLPTAGGGTQCFRGFKIMWERYDIVLTESDIEPIHIVEVAKEYSREWDMPFWRSFPLTVCYFLDEYVNNRATDDGN